MVSAIVKQAAYGLQYLHASNLLHRFASLSLFIVAMSRRGTFSSTPMGACVWPIWVFLA